MFRSVDLLGPDYSNRLTDTEIADLVRAADLLGPDYSYSLSDTEIASLVRVAEGIGPDRDSLSDIEIADLVRATDLLDQDYSPPGIEINDLKPSATVTSPGTAARLAPVQQYFDPGLRNPDLATMRKGERYLLHIFNVHPGVLQVNWAFEISGAREDRGDRNDDDDDDDGRDGRGNSGGRNDDDDDDDDRSGGGGKDGDVQVILKVMEDVENHVAGGHSGCPRGRLLSLKEREFGGNGAFSISSGPIDITEPGIYSVAFCVRNLDAGALTTKPFKPTGSFSDTWVYAIAFKDYKITSQVEGAFLTAYVRQMPGPTQPPGGAWSNDNISWIDNLVTPYQWDR